MRKAREPSRIVLVRERRSDPSTNTPLPAADPDVVRTIRGNFTFVLLHAGNLGFYGAWEHAADGSAHNWRAMELVWCSWEMVRSARRSKRCCGAGNVRFSGFFPCSEDSVGTGSCRRAHHHREAGAGRRGRAQQNYGILAAGKPIVAVAPEETDVVTLAGGAGSRFLPIRTKPADVVSAVRLLAGDAQKLKIIGRGGASCLN